MNKEIGNTDIEKHNPEKGFVTNLDTGCRWANFNCKRRLKIESFAGALRHREVRGRKQNNEWEMNYKVQPQEKEKNHVK